MPPVIENAPSAGVRSILPPAGCSAVPELVTMKPTWPLPPPAVSADSPVLTDASHERRRRLGGFGRSRWFRSARWFRWSVVVGRRWCRWSRPWCRWVPVVDVPVGRRRSSRWTCSWSGCRATAARTCWCPCWPSCPPMTTPRVPSSRRASPCRPSCPMSSRRYPTPRRRRVGAWVVAGVLGTSDGDTEGAGAAVPLPAVVVVRDAAAAVSGSALSLLPDAATTTTVTTAATAAARPPPTSTDGRKSRRTPLAAASVPPAAAPAALPPAMTVAPTWVSTGTAGQGRQVSGRSRPEEQRCEQTTQTGVDLGELGGDRRAPVALGEMGLDLGGLPLGQSAAGVSTQPFQRRAAPIRHRLGHVHLQVRLAQALTCAERERGDGVGRHAEQQPDLGGALTLDLGVPQDGLPPFRQLGERLPDVGGLHLPQDRIVLLEGRLVRGDVVGELEPLVLAGPVVGGVPDAGEQIGAERRIGTAPVEERVQHPGERLRDQVVGLGGGVGQLAGHRGRRSDVPTVERAEGRAVATADARNQFGIAGDVFAAGGRVHPALHTVLFGSPSIGDLLLPDALPVETLCFSRSACRGVLPFETSALRRSEAFQLTRLLPSMRRNVPGCTAPCTSSPTAACCPRCRRGARHRVKPAYGGSAFHHRCL